MFRRLFQRPTVREVTVDEVHEWLAQRSAQRPVIVDVREPHEHRTGVIQGARLIPLGQLATRVQELPPGREIWCICAHGNRSCYAVTILATAGIENAASVAGGMHAWRANGLPIVRK